MKKKILLLEDDMTLHETMFEYLESCGYEVSSFYDGDSTESALFEKQFDLLVLDVNVPGINGFELLKNTRAEGKNTPAIFITSLNAMSDVEKGYESGCDDYLRKPFALKELKLRIETLLKREFFHALSEQIDIAKDIHYETNNDTLIINGKMQTLSNKETKLLKLFLQNKNTLLTHETIYETLWEYNEEISESSLRTYIKNLRKYLGGERIVSIKKLGYRFTSE